MKDLTITWINSSKDKEIFKKKLAQSVGLLTNNDHRKHEKKEEMMTVQGIIPLDLDQHYLLFF